MRKKKKMQSTDEIVVFSDEAQQEAVTNEAEAVEEVTDELKESEELSDSSEAEISEQSTNVEEVDEQPESFIDESDKKEKKKSKKSFKLGLKKKSKKEELEERESKVFEDEEYIVEFEQSEGTVTDIEVSEDEYYETQDEQLEEEVENKIQHDDASESVDEYKAEEPVENEIPEFNPDAPVEYSKAVDTLPSAKASDDVYADIVKNIDEEVHGERTSRQTKYEREQYFVSSENPFQRDRDKLEAGEENLSYEEIKRKELKTFDEMFSAFKVKIFPQKGEKKSERIRKAVSNTAVFVLICCAVAFGVIFVQSKRAEKQQLGLSSQIIDITSAEEEEQLWEEFRAKYPNIKTPEGMMAKYAYLYAINQQLVGWVSIPNSGVDVQVVQAADNKAYLKKDFYGNYSRYGCPFMDYRNDPKYLNQNTIIYGHHMSDGLIFAELSKYKELDGFLESPVICFDTLYKTYYFKIYAAFITNTREEDDNGYVFNYTVTSFESPQNFDGYIAALDERKLYTTGVDINSGDKLLTLSTCTYEFNDARLVIIGRMLRTGETVDIDTTYSTKNGNPHYPQIWYDKNGKSNPFAGAERWYPEG